MQNQNHRLTEFKYFNTFHYQIVYNKKILLRKLKEMFDKSIEMFNI